MKRILICFALGLLFSSAFTMAQSSAADSGSKAAAAPQSRWFARIGAAGVIYHPGAKVSAGGAVVPGASATVSNNETLIFDGGYYFTKNVAASLFAGVPPKPTLTGTGAIASYGDLGSVWYGPAVASAHYHFNADKAFQPYVGAGVAYAIILKKHNEALKNMQVHNNFAPVAQVGADMMFNKHWGTFIDCKQIWLSVDAHGKIAGVVPAQARVKLYPTVVSAGLKYRF